MKESFIKIFILKRPFKGMPNLRAIHKMKGKVYCQNNSDYNRNPKRSEKKPFPSSYLLLNSQLDYISQASLHLDMAMCLNFSQ